MSFPLLVPVCEYSPVTTARVRSLPHVFHILLGHVTRHPFGIAVLGGFRPSLLIGNELFGVRQRVPRLRCSGNTDQGETEQSSADNPGPTTSNGLHRLPLVPERKAIAPAPVLPYVIALQEANSDDYHHHLPRNDHPLGRSGTRRPGGIRRYGAGA